MDDCVGVVRYWGCGCGGVECAVLGVESTGEEDGGGGEAVSSVRRKFDGGRDEIVKAESWNVKRGSLL